MAKSSEINSIYLFGEYSLDATERKLRRGSTNVTLSPKAFDLLMFLVESDGKLLKKESLMAAVWPDAMVEENNLTVSISMLRKALGDSEECRYIETVPKTGYRFVASVIRSAPEERAETNVEGQPTLVEGGAESPVRAWTPALSASIVSRWRTRALLILLAVVLAATGDLASISQTSNDDKGFGDATTAGDSAVSESKRSAGGSVFIAVASRCCDLAFVLDSRLERAADLRHPEVHNSGGRLI